MSRRKIGNVWRDMKKRCYNPKSTRYHRYGARGIVICDEWREDFEKFYSWSLANGYEPGLSIDRIDNDGNYEPGNCRWATQSQQAATRSTTNLVSFGGETLRLSEWAARTGLSRDTLYERIFIEKWEIGRALTTPAQRKQKIAHLERGNVPPDQILQRATELKAAGHGYDAIARLCGRSADYFRRLLDPEYRAQSNARSAARMRERYASKRKETADA